jgi:ABC-2 type transport system ATP-binding protein
MDHGRIVVLDTPQSLKAGVGKDRITLSTADNAAAIAALREQFGIEAAVHDGAVTFAVAGGAQFVPRLFGRLGMPISAVQVARPSLDDVFLEYTGSTIRDAESSVGTDRIRMAARR